MKKITLMIGMLLMLISTALAQVELDVSVAEKFCTDSDGGLNVWSGGIATTEKGNDVDDCDGASSNLKEFTCEDDKSKVNTENCDTYDAICVSAGDETVADYCACPQGWTFSARDGKCVEGDVVVPEFGLLGGIAATLAAGLFIAGIRKR
ncbi:MAG: hypothetical protein HZB67_03130 [Candidatus Aenigmarchaeota archaeon]|nr:hypothetical protein [Candidatus Aenigmarchaeota archaeon]